MSPLRLGLRLVLLFSTLIVFSACGSSRGSGGSAQSPIFTSTPPTAAVQDTAYTYAIAATDPAGGTVSFALTGGPNGASLSGSTLNWTPAASQSRLANSFTVTANTSEGGTATQSWSISPAGTVTVNWVNTYWEPGGPVKVPISPSASLMISAVVPQPDGSLTVLNGSTSAPGVITIKDVPAGYYWLALGNSITPVYTSASWTSTSTFDAGFDIAGLPLTTLSAATDTTFDLNLSGLDSVSSQSLVGFNLETQLGLPYLPDAPDSSTLSISFSDNSTVDWSQAKDGFLMQYEPETFGPWTSYLATHSAVLSNLSFTNGTTNTISQTLQASPVTSLAMNVAGSQWNAQFAGAAPYPASSYASGFSLAAEPWVTGIDARGTGLGNPVLAGTAIALSGLGFSFQPFGGCDPATFLVTPFSVQPAILTDQNLGTLQYGDPFDAAWTRSISFCEEALIPVPLPNSSATQDFALVNSVRMAPSGSPLAPLAAPVQSATINGSSLFAPATLNTATPALNWSAGGGSTPAGYTVQVYVATTLPTGQVIYRQAGIYSTAKTSLTPLPLSGGNTYVFSITTLVNPGANLEASPHRSALPNGAATVLSAPITISSGVASPRIRGNARLVKRFSQPAP